MEVFLKFLVMIIVLETLEVQVWLSTRELTINRINKQLMKISFI